jgi:hypothetical protein
LEESAPAIKQHAAIIHAEGGFLCSGVYAASCGYLGILTAGHCAREFVTKRVALTTSGKHSQIRRFWRGDSNSGTQRLRPGKTGSSDDQSI